MKLRPEVQRFAEEMEKQLQANEHKGGWEDCTQEFLLSELNKNKVRLLEAIYGHNPIRREAKISRRCANIANFAMMIADNWGEGENICPTCREGGENDRTREVDKVRKEVEQLREALKHACIAVEIYSGSCPYDKHDSCQFPGRCTDQYSECWQEYFISKVKPPGERTDSK